jgi:hypothetical protein
MHVITDSRPQAIKLRLRTDSYDGFRSYADVRRVLMHELTHNVWGPHDNNVRSSSHANHRSRLSVFLLSSSKSSIRSSIKRLRPSKRRSEMEHTPSSETSHPNSPSKTWSRSSTLMFWEEVRPVAPLPISYLQKSDVEGWRKLH